VHSLTQVLTLRRGQPRSNLPRQVCRKRGESNFVLAFARAYIASFAPHGLGAREFALSGFGIADLVWVVWERRSRVGEGTGLSVENRRTRSQWQKLTAFEMKLTDWRKGMAQAYRYSYFADIAVLVLPPNTARVAKAELKRFRELGLGLWSFDKASGKIRKLTTPRSSGPRNSRANERALESLNRLLKLRQFAK
jgi:hypothetical protein